MLSTIKPRNLVLDLLTNKSNTGGEDMPTEQIFLFPSSYQRALWNVWAVSYKVVL